MEKNLNDLAVHRAVTRQAEAILNATTAFGVRDLSELEYVGRILGIFREEREHLTKAEIDLAKAASEGASGPGVNQ